MSELRWVLLILGVLIVGAIYLLWGRDLGWRSRRSGDNLEPTQTRREPGFSGAGATDSGMPRTGPEDETPQPVVVGETESPRADSPPAADFSRPASGASKGHGATVADTADAAQGPQKIVVLHVASRGSVHFSGEEVVAALENENMQLGKFDIFHRLESSSSNTLFSAASMVEPGTFDLARLADVVTPGLSLFLVLPGPIDGAEAFSEMLITARNLAQRLGAEVLDDQGSSLSNQTAGHIREQILSFQLRLRALDDVRA